MGTSIIFFSAKTQYQNLGDMIINREILLQLRNYGKLIVDDKGVPEWFCNDLEIDFYERSSNYNMTFEILIIWYALKALFKKECKIYFVLKPGHFYGEFSFIHLLKLLYFVIIKFFGVRICRFGASIGPFSKSMELIESFKSKLMYFYSVRDGISKDYAHQIGIEKVFIFPDMAWIMKATNESFVKPTKGDKYVVFSFRKSTHNLGAILEYKNYLFETLDKIIELVCKKWSYKLVLSYQVEDDKNICQELMQKYKDIYNVSFMEKKINLQTAYTLYSGAEMVFSNRLHVLMLAILSGSLPIGVVDIKEHNKITGIFADEELSNLIINIYSKQSIIDSLSDIVNKKYLFRKQLDTCLERQRNKASELFLSVFGDNDI
ncbi:MAG: polysaccharide pyruvyl transferase family protein [Richelia sp. SM1_7_0]|nr:polysaccharide pyruvyl transferase family protein [Richelia sp. SM1_7_0]